ncbi:hypothetical protein FE257_001815 [Aspergillus nanangensis]|uniref:F-box domain-containing protein n=1 Tax=Aspergillus nanangensis TaxID=2582783 RepID=A0AAD4CDD7_ASPNN|nr:hypothetical protein FE257_001815 [Aspergillus nanangensis]
MGWMIYCAICGGPFSSQIDMGDPEGTEDDCYRPWGNNTAELVNLIAYHDWAEGGEPHVFPFHPICYDNILRRCLHPENPEQSSREALWNVFEDLNGGMFRRLQLDYGKPEPSEGQVWDTRKGHEVLVVNPVQIPELDTGLASITKALTNNKALHWNPTTKDLFDKLPAELRQEIFHLLPLGSILALRAASWTMHTTPLSSSFWTQRLENEIPWLWEINTIDLLHSQEVENKAANLLLDIQAKSQFTPDNDDYIFGLANRRRIWGVCEQIRDRYFKKLEELRIPINMNRS